MLIRRPEEADRDEFLRAMRASRGLQRPWVNDVDSDDYFDRMLARVLDERHDPSLVCRTEDGVIVGMFNIGEIVRGAFQSGFLSYAAVSGYDGRGYMSEGIQLVLKRAFVDLRLHRIEANIQPANTRSKALVRGAGFVYEGVSERYLKVAGRWRDHEHWAMLVEQWRPR